MRRRKEIDFRNFAQLPLDLDEDPLSALLAQPPSASGLQAQYRLKEVEYWARQKVLAFDALEAASAPIAATSAEAAEASMLTMHCVDPNSTEHAETVATFRVRLKEHHDHLEKCYKEFTKADEKLTRARAQLSTVYDTRLLEVAAAEDQAILEQEALNRPTGASGDESMEAMDESSEALRKLNEEAAKLSMAELAARLVRNPSAGWSLTDRGKRIIYLMTCVQSRVRMCIVLRKMRSLRRSRRLLDRICLEYQFYFWRKYVQAVTRHRRKLMLSVFVPLQGYANLARLRRGVFALHFTRAKIAGMIFRIFELWRRLAVLHNTPASGEGSSRAVFSKYMSEWEDCLALEARERNLVRLAAITGGPAAKVYELAHFWRRWRCFQKIERRERSKMSLAVRHASRRCVQRHFYAWMDIISFTAQRDASTVAKKQLYFGVWQRLVDRNKLERARAAAIVPLKKLRILNQWRKRVVDLRLKRTASNVVLLGNKPLLHHVISCWTGNTTQQTFISAWRRWKLYVRRRLAFKTFVGLRWQRRAEFLKKTAFAAWLAFRKDDDSRPSSHQSSRRVLFPPGLPGDAVEDLTNVESRHRLLLMLLSLAQNNLELEALGPPPAIEVIKLVPQASKSQPLKPVPTVEPYVFNPGELVVGEAPPLLPIEAIMAERRASAGLYKSWAAAHQPRQAEHGQEADDTAAKRVSTLDKCLLTTLFHLAVAQNRRKQPAATASSSSIVDDGTPDVEESMNPRLVRDYSIVALVGFPFHDMSKNEVRIAELEQFLSDDCATNYIIGQRKLLRDNRIDRKTSMRIAALRLFDKCSYFGCEPIESRSIGFSPFKYLMDQYTAIRDGEGSKKKNKKKKSTAGNAVEGRRGKFLIPLPPVPRKRQLPFLLRLHLSTIVSSAESKTHMSCHRFSRVRLQRAILLMRLHSLVRVDSSDLARQRRISLVSSMTSAEEKGLKPDVVARKMQALSDPHKEFVVVRRIKCCTLDLLGFNPRFLKGAMQQRTKRLGKLRQLMRDAKALLSQCKVEPLLLAREAPLRRTFSSANLEELENFKKAAESRAARPRAQSGRESSLPRVLEIVERAPPTPPKAAAPLVPLFAPEDEVVEEESDTIDASASEEQLDVSVSQTEQAPAGAREVDDSDSLEPFPNDPQAKILADLSSDDEEMLAELGGAKSRRGKTLAERGTTRNQRSVLDKSKKQDLRDLNALRAEQEQEAPKRSAANDEEEIVFPDEPTGGEASPGTKVLTEEFASRALLGDNDDDGDGHSEDGESQHEAEGQAGPIGTVQSEEGRRLSTGGELEGTSAASPSQGTTRADGAASAGNRYEGASGAGEGRLSILVGSRVEGSSRIPRLWSDDGKPFVPALERLLEVSSRFGTLLNQQTRRQLEELKVKVLQLAGDVPTNETIAAHTKAYHQIGATISGLKEPRAAASASPPKKDTGKPPAPRAVHSSPPAKPAAAQRTQSPGDTSPTAIVTVVPQASSAPSEYYQPPRVFKGVDEAQILMLEPEKQRVDLSRSGPSLADRRMQSTANLINDLIDTSTLSTAAQVPQHPLLREVMRKHPRRVNSADLSPRTSAEGGSKLAVKLRSTVMQPPRVQLDDAFQRWVELAASRLRHKATFAEAIEDVLLEESVLQRRLAQTASIPDPKIRDVLVLGVSTQLRIVQQLKLVQSPAATTSELLDPAVEKVSFSTTASARRSIRALPTREATAAALRSTSAVEPLTDIEVSRLVTMIVSKDLKRQ